MKTHLMRSERSTWCGRSTGGKRMVTRRIDRVTCKVCLKADAAEQARNS